MNPIGRKGNQDLSFTPDPLHRNLFGLFTVTATLGAAALSRGRIKPIHQRLLVSHLTSSAQLPALTRLQIAPSSDSKRTIPFDLKSSTDKAKKAFSSASLFFAPIAFCEKKTKIEQQTLLPLIPLNDPLRQGVTSKIVGQEADFLIKDTSLEGAQFEDMAKHLIAFISFCEKNGILSEKTIQNLKTFFQNIEYVPSTSIPPEERTALAQKIANKVFTLKPGQSLTMTGGWVDKETRLGHALLYQFTKREDGCYDIHIYNTGAGVEKYHSKLLIEEKTRTKILFCPYVQFQKVPPERLGFFQGAHPEFFERLIHIQQGATTSGNRSGLYMIYESPDGFGGFHDKLAKAGPHTHYMKPQRAGTCAFSVFLAATHSLFGSVEEYKKFKFELKYTHCILLFEKIKSTLKNDSEEQELLEKQGMKLSNSLEKRVNIYSRAERMEKEASLNAVLEHIATLPKKVPVIPHQMQPAIDQSRFDTSNLSLGSISSQSTSAKTITSFQDTTILFVHPNSDNLMSYISKIRKAEEEPTLFIHGVEKLGKAFLNFSKEDIEKIPQESLELLLRNLTHIINHYERKMYDQTLQSSLEYTNTTWAFLSLAYSLSCRLVPALKEHGLAYSQLISPDFFPFCYSTKEQENFHKMITVFQNQSNTPRLFDFPKINYLTKETPYPPDVAFKWHLLHPDQKPMLTLEEAAVLLAKTTLYETGQHLKSLTIQENRYLPKYERVTISVNSTALALCNQFNASKKGLIITLLQQMAFIAQVANADLDTFGDDPKRLASNIYHPEIEKKKDSFNILYRPWIKWNPKIKNYERLLPEKENTILTLIDSRREDIIPEISTCQKSLTPSKLLYFFSENYLKLTEVRGYTEHLFFQLLFQRNQDIEKDPPIFKAVKDPAFIHQLNDFIKEGITFFSSGIFAHKPDILSCLFFARLSRRIQELNPDLPLTSFQDKINTWLKTPHLDLFTSRVIHLHRILQYKNSDPEHLQPKELKEIFTSWILCSQDTFSSSGDSARQKEEASRFILSLAPKLKELSTKDLDAILCETLGKTSEELNLSSQKWTSDVFPLYKKGSWSLNLLTGEIAKDDIVIEFDTNIHMPKHENYQALFGKDNFPYTKQGNAYTFTDPKTGFSFRVIKNKYNDLDLQISYEGNWYEYRQKISQITWGNIPHSLQSYHFFVNGSSALFIDPVTRTVTFEITKSGTLINKTSNTQVSYVDDIDMPEADLFEPPNWRLHEKQKNGKTIIRFPRYKTANGNELRLIEKKNGGFALEENDRFLLIKPIKGMIGPLKNVLCFQHLDTKEIKIIVPMREGKSEKSLAPTSELSLDPPLATYENMTTKNNLGKTFTYAEYLYDKKRIVPKDPVDKLFLSYLLLLQKKEKSSLALLESLGTERSFPPPMQQILSWMTNSPNKTPSGLSVAVKAALILSRKDPSQRGTLSTLFDEYRTIYTSIPAHLRLSSLEVDEIQTLCARSPIPEGELSRAELIPSQYEKLQQALKVSSAFESETYGFSSLYDDVMNAPTQEKKTSILARASLEKFRESEQAILLLAKQYRPGFLSSGPQEWASSNRYTSYSTSLFKNINWFRYNVPVYTIPPCEGAIDSTLPLLEGAPITPLETVLERATIPSYRQSSLSSKITPPVLDLQETFVKPFFIKVRPVAKAKTAPLKIPSSTAPLYTNSVKRNLKKVNEEIALGDEITANTSSFLPRKEANLFKLKEQLTDQLTSLESFLLQSKEAILLLARQSPENLEAQEITRRIEKGGYKEVAQFENVITHYLRGDYSNLNSHLTKKELVELDEKVKEFLIQATKAQQIERALLQKDPNLMASILDAPMAYTPSNQKEERAFLVYEYRSGLRIRPLQETSIRHMLQDQNLVLQMMMGEGKTTVLTSIFLEMVEPGKIPIYIPPDAQFETQVSNLINMQHKHFYKPPIPIRFSREELTLENLTWIDRKLEQAKKGTAIIATKNTLASLRLEWYSLLDKDPSTLSWMERQKIDLLTKIRANLKANGVVLLDEVDDLLDPSKELNFPIGEKLALDPHYIDFITTIFQLHLSPEIEQSLRLTRNEQSSFSTKKYKEEIIPQIAYKLLEEYHELLGIEDALKKPCFDYIVDGIETADFLSFLEQRIHSKDPAIARSAELIYLAKGLFRDLLPSILQKEENRNYGIPEGATKRKVIPFEGAKSPALTEFAGPYEAACYHIVTALSNVVSKAQLEQVASQFLEKVLPILPYTKSNLEDSPEGKQFFHLTGVQLERFHQKDPAAAEEALAYLERHPEKRLELEKIFIKEFVGAYTSYFQSTSQNFLSLFSQVIGITGTPKNPIVFPDNMPVLEQKGALGKIRSKFLERSDNKTSRIYINKTNEIGEVLASSLQKNPRKEQFRALLDPAGRFRGTSNRSVAEGILTYFENDPTIEAVLFYERGEGNFGIPGTLMVLKKTPQRGIFFSEKIPGTDAKTLSDKGLDPERTITFYDEKHCEATDIPQIPTALGLVTINSHLVDRDFLQTDLRLRGYLGLQDVDVLIHENELPNYPEELTGRDILTQMEVAQAIKNADEAFPVFRQKMNNIIKQKADDILSANPTHATMQKVRKALVIEQDLSPHVLFGGISNLEDPLTLFDAYQKTLEMKFPDLIDSAVQEEFRSLRNALIKNIDQFPSLVPVSQSGAESAQKEICLQQEVKQEVSVQISLELQQEHQRYQSYFTGSPFKEAPWTNPNIALAVGGRTEEHPSIMTLSSLFQSWFVSYQKPYYKLFEGSNLLLSENFAYTKTFLLPVFSKSQKPAEQILIREDDDGFKVLLLSAEEGALFKEKIENGLQNTWLYLPNGKMHIEPTLHNTPQNTKMLQKVLFEVNLFNGNARYFLEHREETIAYVKNDPERKELFIRFLGVKAQGDPSQQGALDRITLELKTIP